MALLYSIGAHGIMTLNDFKSVQGDRELGLRSLPARYGPHRAAIIACWFMTLPQLVVIALLIESGAVWQAGVVSVLVTLQLLAMGKMLKQPEALAPWYNGTGVTAYVTGMMVTATAVPGMLS